MKHLRPRGKELKEIPSTASETEEPKPSVTDGCRIQRYLMIVNALESATKGGDSPVGEIKKRTEVS